MMNIDHLIAQATLFQDCYPHHGTRKNYFLAACTLFSSESLDIDQLHVETPFGGMIGIGNSRLHRYLARYKLFRLHAIIHDAAGLVKSRYNSGPGYCYMFSCCPINSYFLGHVTGILFCIYSKLFNPSYSRLKC